MSLLSELYRQGRAVPPVSPEVIKILLFQRSRRQSDAPAEHVRPGELCDGRIVVRSMSGPGSCAMGELYK